MGALSTSLVLPLALLLLLLHARRASPFGVLDDDGGGVLDDDGDNSGGGRVVQLGGAPPTPGLAFGIGGLTGTSKENWYVEAPAPSCILIL